MDVLQLVDPLSHFEAEVAEPFVVESHCPVFRKEFDNVGDYACFVSGGKSVKVVFMESDKGPKRLDNHVFGAHVGDCVD